MKRLSFSIALGIVGLFFLPTSCDHQAIDELEVQPYLFLERGGAIAIAKYDRATLFFKLFFTEEGKKREPEYIEQLSGSFWYEEGWAHGKETRFVPTEN